MRDNAAERLGKLAVTPKMTQNQFLLHHKEIAKRTCHYVMTLVTPENVSSVFSRITESAPKYGVFLDVFDIRQNPHLKTQMIHIPLTTHVISHLFGVQDPIKSFGTVSRLRRRNGRDLGLLISRTSRRSYQLKRLNLTIC